MASDSIPRIRIEPAAEDRSAAADASMQAAAGELAEDYTPVSRIGKGGMGVVYLARDRRLGRYVAIKRLNDSSRTDAMLRRRFLREAHAMAALNHIHIVHVYALGEDAEGPYIVMEYVEGPVSSPGQDADSPNPPFSMEDLVKRRGPLESGEAAALVAKIARAVAYAHSTGVIHRDLKPANVLIDSSGEPKLADFGLAHVLDSSALALTLPGEKILSLGYAAPEQELDASKADERADVYGLGGILYFALTGRNPRYFREQEAPEELRKALVSALEPDRERRCQSAKAFAAELSAAAGKSAREDDAREEPPAQRATWRCKWCDALNPATLRFCTSCGWDGSTECPECGEPSFTGIRYCQKCGADARAYESAQTALMRVRRAKAEKRWADVPAEALRARGFTASGPNGRKIAREIAEEARAAAENLRECEELAERIPEEMRAANYERAREMIERFAALAKGGNAFAAELASIPDLIFARDSKRAARAARERDFKTLAALCASLSAARPDAPELQEPLAALSAARARKRRAGVLSAAACAAVVLGTVAAIWSAAVGGEETQPPGPDGEERKEQSQTAAGEHHRAAPLSAEQEEKLLGTISSAAFREKIDADGRFSDLYVRVAATPAFAAAMIAPADEAPALAKARGAYLDALAALADRRKHSGREFLAEYMTELEDLRRNFQYEGATDEEEAMSDELKRVDEIARDRPLASADLYEDPAAETRPPEALVALRTEFSRRFGDMAHGFLHDLESYVSNYVAVISEQRKSYTQKGDRASAVRLRAEEREIVRAIDSLAARDRMEAQLAEMRRKEAGEARRRAEAEAQLSARDYFELPDAATATASGAGDANAEPAPREDAPKTPAPAAPQPAAPAAPAPAAPQPVSPSDAAKARALKEWVGRILANEIR